MEDLLGALMQGAQQEPDQEDAGAEGDPLGQLLQGLLGGQAPQESATEAEPASIAGGMDVGGLLQGLLGGAGQSATGYGTQPAAASGQGGLDLGGMLQGVLGGGGGLASVTGQAAPSGGDLGGILGALMGGGSPAAGSNSFLAPIVTGLAEKLGLPPQIAQTVVVFVLGKLMGHRLQPGIETDSASTRSGAARSQAAGLEEVLHRMNAGERVTKTAIRDAGLVEELEAQTGLDRHTAEASLQQVFNALGAQLGDGE